MVTYTKFRDDPLIRSRVIFGKPEGGCINPPVPARVNMHRICQCFILFILKHLKWKRDLYRLDVNYKNQIPTKPFCIWQKHRFLPNYSYLQGVPQLMSHPKITRHSKTGTRLVTVFLHTHR